MSNYTFESLSPIDFENLCRDLLQEELLITLESFAAGRDSGIDFRYSKGDNNLIVQAKHYRQSGFKKLLSNLKKEEKKKVEKLKPTRYIICTSVLLSPDNKDEIFKTFSPYIKELSDIYGSNDINNLLGKNPGIIKKNFKLWMQSIDVLEQVLHAKILNQSKLRLEEIKEKSKVYVFNSSFDKALRILKENNYVVIAGIPGIGKSTLAQMLIFHFLSDISDKWELIDITSDINEAIQLLDPSKKRIFFYDDFLGQTSFDEKMNKNEDKLLTRLIAFISGSKNFKLILTTREYILKQAQRFYTSLNDPCYNMSQCIVDLSQYTRPIRGDILYNHLYFSNLETSLLEEIIATNSFLKILDHSNFNPRIIEYLVKPFHFSKAGKGEFVSYILESLDNPHHIWQDAFENHLSDICREILIIIRSMGPKVLYDDLFLAIQEYSSLSKSHKKQFEQSLSLLTGNFLTTIKTRNDIVIAFHNPSIHDFLTHYMRYNSHIIPDILEKAVFIEQITYCIDVLISCENMNYHEQLVNDAIIKALKIKSCSISIHSDSADKQIIWKEHFRIDKFLIYLLNHYIEKKLLFAKHSIVCIANTFIDQLEMFENCSFPNNTINLIIYKLKNANLLENKKFEYAIHLSEDYILTNLDSINAIEEAYSFYEDYPNLCDESKEALLHDAISQEISYLYNLGCDELETVDSALFELINLCESYNLDFDKEIKKLDNRLDELRNEASMYEEEEEDYHSIGNTNQNVYVSNQALIEKFSTLTQK